LRERDEEAEGKSLRGQCRGSMKMTRIENKGNDKMERELLRKLSNTKLEF